MKCITCGKNINLENIESYSFKDKENKLESICNECNTNSLKNNMLKLMRISEYSTTKPIGLWVFPIIIILFNLYYWYPVYSGNWESIDSIFEISLFAAFFWFNIILLIIDIYAVTIGFYFSKNWARQYEIAHLSYSSLWAIISMFVMRWQIIEHYFYLVMYIVLIAYLLQSSIREYFTCKQ